MDGDRDDVPTQATPQSSDSLSSTSELESEWQKLKFEFQGVPLSKLSQVPSALPPSSQTITLRPDSFDESMVPDIPQFLGSSAEPIGGFKKETVRCVSFLHDSLAEKQVLSRDNDFLVVTRKQIVVCGLPPYGEGHSFVEKVRLIDESPTEKFMVARFLLSQTAPFRIVAAGRDGIIKIMTPEIPEARYGLMGHRHTVRDLRPMDDCDFLLSCGDDLSIRLWNVKARVQIALFQGILAHSDSIRSIDLHYSQTQFISSGFDRCLQLWTMDDKVTALKALSKFWNSDCRRVAGVRCSKRHFETKLVTQSTFFTFQVHVSKVTLVRFYHDLIVSQDKTNRVCVWQPNPTRGECSFILIHSLQPPMTVRSAFALSAETGLLACAGDSGEIWLWSLFSPVSAPCLLKKPFNVTIKGLSFSSDGSVLVGRCKEGLLIRFDVWC